MRAFRVIVGGLLAAFAVGVFASGGTSAPARTEGLEGTIATVSGGIEITIKNTGPDTYRFVQIVLPSGLHHLGASADNGNSQAAACGAGFTNGDVMCAFNPGFAPGQTHVIKVLLDGPFPTSGAAALNASASSPASLVAVGQAKLPAGPCNCLTLTARIIPNSIKFTNPGDTSGMKLEFTVAWTLNCLTGSGGCSGTLDLVAPSGPSFKSSFAKPGAHIACTGACAKLTQGTQAFILKGNRGLGGDRRGKKVKSIDIVIKRTCQSKAVAPMKLTLVFDKRTALVDKAKSRLR